LPTAYRYIGVPPSDAPYWKPKINIPVHMVRTITTCTKLNYIVTNKEWGPLVTDVFLFSGKQTLLSEGKQVV
jgi:hypothetical protein